MPEEASRTLGRKKRQEEAKEIEEKHTGKKDEDPRRNKEKRQANIGTDPFFRGRTKRPQDFLAEGKGGKERKKKKVYPYCV